MYVLVWYWFLYKWFKVEFFGWYLMLDVKGRVKDIWRDVKKKKVEGKDNKMF